MANFWSGNTEMLDKYKHAWNLKKPVTCFSGICLHMELMSTIFLLVSLQSKEHDTPNSRERNTRPCIFARCGRGRRNLPEALDQNLSAMRPGQGKRNGCYVPQ